MLSARRWLSPLIVLLIGLAVTTAAAVAISRAEAGRQNARFEGLADSAVGAIQARMLAQLTLLRGAAGFFNASDDITDADFHAFVERLRLDRHYPGVLGIGYAAFAPDRRAIGRIAAEQRRLGKPGFRLWPDGDREFYSTIVYLEPLDRLNQAAIGYDMLSQSTRREAMIAAAAAASSQTSGKVRLVQEIDPVKQPGFLVYLPLYRGAHDVRGEAAMGQLRGWVYSPLRAYDLFGAIFSQHELDGIAVAIFDSSVAPDNLLYRSHQAEGTPALQVQRTISVSGRNWVVQVSSLPAFADTSPYRLAWVVAAAGTLITLLVTLLLAQQVRAGIRTERQVLVRTAELRESNARLVAEAAARAKAESQVRQMQKMEAIGQLTGGIAHDFNNMLAVVIGNLDMAERRSGEPERLRRALSNARLGAEKAAELTSRLLAFGRQQALAPRAINANALISGMTELLRRSLGEAVQLETVLDERLWTILADPTQLENAILNIAINARDAMPDGGQLTIETQNAAVDEELARASGDLDPGDYVTIAISDNGTGMSEEVAAKAVEPFFTTKDVGKGTGLGLSQVYGFVRQSGGHLHLWSEPGQGTTVTLYLSRHSGAAEPEREREKAEGGDPVPPARAGESILVVEDDEHVREISVQTLSDLGYAVIAAADGESALALLREGVPVDLLFSDMVMPGMNGHELAAAARQMRPDLKFLFATGYSRDVAEGAPGSDTPVLQKPFSAPELARRIREQLDSSGGS